MFPWQPTHGFFFKVILLIKKYQHLTIFYYHDGPCLNIHDNCLKCTSETNSRTGKHNGRFLAEHILNCSNLIFFGGTQKKRPGKMEQMSDLK